MPRRSDYIVGSLLLLSLLAALGGSLWALYQSDRFVERKVYNLKSDSGDGLSVNMAVVYSGFPIGKVTDLELTEAGDVWIRIAVPEKETKWLRSNSRFLLDQPLLGSPRIIVETNNLQAPPLTSEGVFATLTRPEGFDATLNEIKPILENVNQITALLADSSRKDSIAGILADVKSLTARLEGEKSILNWVSGEPESGQKLDQTIQEAMGMVTDIRKQVMDDEEGVIVKVRKVLSNLSTQIANLKPILTNIENTTGNISTSTEDLSDIRKQIDLAVERINEVIERIDKIIPFKKEAEWKLP